MTTNGEWLDYLAQNAPDELAAWFDAERTESPTSATMQQIGQVIENTVKRGVYGYTEPENEDSRDKIEADVRKIAEAYNMDSQRHGTERFAHELYHSIIHLLNRQMAIDDSICDECSSDFYKLQEDHDKLVDEVGNLADERYRYKLQCERYEAQIAELTAERDNWKANCEDWKKHARAAENACYETMLEREEYRNKFGKCLDYADAIHALMDDEDMA